MGTGTRLVHRNSLASVVFVGWLVVTAGNAHAARIELLGENDTDGLVPGPVATDRNYTQGSRISITDISPRWARWAADRVPGFGLTGRDGSERVRYFGVSIGQDIYTPDKISKRTQILNDEPYAGWLYASAFMTVEDPRWQRTWSFRPATTGPMSQADDVQTWWHKHQGIRLPRGWQYQLRNEPGLMARARCAGALAPDIMWTSFPMRSGTRQREGPRHGRRHGASGVAAAR
jgi:hypothetical protein